jgi:hypothetical protein
MSFHAEGTYKVEIVEAFAADPKFAQPPAFDVVLKVRTEDGQSDWWRGEMSANYGKGNFADRTQAQITMNTLTQLGLENDDLSNLESLIGKTAEVTVEGSVSKTNGKTYYNVKYFNTGESIQKIDAATLQQRLHALGVGGKAAPAPGAAQQAATVAPAAAPAAKRNPFLA